MKKLLLLGAAIALCSGVALADTAPPPGDNNNTAPQATTPDNQTDMAAGPSEGDDQGQGWRHGMHRWHHHGMGGGMDGDRDGAGMHGRFGGPMGMHFGAGGFASKAARFVFSGPGGASIIIKCADGDTTQQCADAAKSLIGSVLPAIHQGMGGTGNTAPAPAQ